MENDEKLTCTKQHVQSFLFPHVHELSVIYACVVDVVYVVCASVLFVEWLNLL